MLTGWRIGGTRGHEASASDQHRGKHASVPVDVIKGLDIRSRANRNSGFPSRPRDIAMVRHVAARLERPHHRAAARLHHRQPLVDSVDIVRTGFLCL
jgi:hypothetical protein